MSNSMILLRLLSAGFPSACQRSRRRTYKMVTDAV